MTLSDLSNIAGLVSGFGVLASLIFVGVQLRQNTQAVRAAATQAHTENWQTMLPAIAIAGLARLVWLQWAAGLFILAVGLVFLVLWMPG